MKTYSQFLKKTMAIMLSLALVFTMIPMVPGGSQKAYAADEAYAFVTQPEGGAVASGENLTVSWETNFTPTKQVLCKIIEHPIDGLIPSYTTLRNAATSYELGAVADGYYIIRAYYSDSEYIVSNQIYVKTYTVESTNLFKADSKFYPGGTVAVDLEKVAELNDEWMEAYFNDNIKCEWYREGSTKPFGGKSAYLLEGDVGKKIYAQISCDEYVIRTPLQEVGSCPHTNVDVHASAGGYEHWKGCTNPDCDNYNGSITESSFHLDENEDSKCDVCSVELINVTFDYENSAKTDRVVLFEKGSGTAGPAYFGYWDEKDGYVAKHWTLSLEKTPASSLSKDGIGQTIMIGDAVYTTYWCKVYEKIHFDFTGYEIGANISDGVLTDDIDGYAPQKLPAFLGGKNYVVVADKDGIPDMTDPSTMFKVVTGEFKANTDYWLAVMIGGEGRDITGDIVVEAYGLDDYFLDSPDCVDKYWFGAGEAELAFFKLKPLECKHKWNSGKVTKAATCKEDGVKTYTCTVTGCGATKTEPVAKLTTHIYGADNKCTECGIEKPGTGGSTGGGTTPTPGTGESGGSGTTPCAHSWNAATCTTAKTCKICGVTEGVALGHNAGTAKVTKKATASKSGTKVQKCTKCNATVKTIKIKPAKVSLSKDRFAYTGKAISSKKLPKIVVKDGNGKTIAAKYYTVKKPSNVKKMKAIGRYAYKITFKKTCKEYTGSKTVYLQITPKKTAVSSVKAAKKAVTVKWKKGKKAQVTGYEVIVASNKKFTKNVKTKKIKGYSKTSYKMTKLKAKTKYYVKVRAYKVTKTGTVYGPWSAVKNAKTK